MSYAKPTFIQKFGLILIAACLSVAVYAVMLPGAVSAQTPSPNASQCQGGVNQCVSTCEDDNPDCTADPVFKSCKQDKKTQQYKDCRASNDLFKTYVNPFIRLLSLIVGLAVVIGIAIGGLQYITSAGDPQKAAAGKTHIWNAVIALLVYMFLFALLNFLIPGGIL